MSPDQRAGKCARITAAAVSVREETPSLAKMLDRCISTVLSVTCSRWAIRRLVRPWLTSEATWCSRRVSADSAVRPAPSPAPGWPREPRAAIRRRRLAALRA